MIDKRYSKNNGYYKEYFNCAFVLYGNVGYLENVKKYIIKNFVNKKLVKLIKPTYAKEDLLIVDEQEYKAYIRFKKETKKKYMGLQKEIEKKRFDKSDMFYFAFILRGEVKHIETIRDYIGKQHSVKVVTVNYNKERLFIVDKSQWEYFKKSTKQGERP